KSSTHDLVLAVPDCIAVLAGRYMRAVVMNGALWRKILASGLAYRNPPEGQGAPPGNGQVGHRTALALRAGGTAISLRPRASPDAGASRQERGGTAPIRMADGADRIPLLAGSLAGTFRNRVFMEATPAGDWRQPAWSGLFRYPGLRPLGAETR